MPLRIKLPRDEKILINGAVLENGGDSTTLVVHNKAEILRRKEILTEVEAVTPARRVYYALQCAYMFKENRADYLQKAADFLTDYLDAVPSSAEIIEEIQTQLSGEQYYKALKATNKLLKNEAMRLLVYENLPD